MSNGKQIVDQFIRNKSGTGNAEARRRWHGKFLGAHRSSEFTINMFTEIESHVNTLGWAAYGWAAKQTNIANRLYSNGVTKTEYSSFPNDQKHWDAFYCSRDLNVAGGYRVAGTSLLRIYVKRGKIKNIWNTGGMHLGRNRASAIMVAAKERRPQLSFFGISGPQSSHINEPETALFGSLIKQSTLCIPVPDSITNHQLSASAQLGRIIDIPSCPYDQIERYLTGLV